ncbi:MAG: hypothetical protein ACLGHL_08075 [Actinomycetota bacterium]
MRRKTLVLLALSALTASIFPGAARAQAEPTTYEVMVGAETGPAFSWRFYPSALRVHQGDTIHFSGMVDLTDAGVSAEEFREDKVTTPDGIYSLWKEDPDDDSQKINTLDFWEFVGPPCGTESAPCEYTGAEIHNGLPFVSDDQGFYAVVNAEPGTVFYAVNLFGGTGQMRIEVVADDAAASDQASLDAQSADMLARDTSLAYALQTRLNKPTKHTEDGKTVWDAFAGYDTRYLSFFELFPNRLKVKKGQTVRWHFELNNEIHSATYGRNLGLKVFGESFMPVCDPDGDDGPGPDEEALPDPPFCLGDTTLEVDMHPAFFDEVGNGRLTSKTDVESSGNHTPPDLQWAGYHQGNYWDVKMDKPNTEKGYKFFCLLHGFGMSNKIFVRP